MNPRCVLFDWGDTLMVDFAEYSGSMATWPRVELIPQAAEALVAVRAAGWMTALATNASDSGEPEIRTALARAGISELIDRVYCSRDLGHVKPAREFFTSIARHLSLRVDRIVMVGDSLANDIEGALSAGMRAVLFRQSAPTSPGGDGWWIVGSLGELPQLLEALEPTDLTSAST